MGKKIMMNQSNPDAVNIVEYIPSINSILDDILVALSCDVKRLAQKAKTQSLSQTERKALSDYSQTAVRVGVEHDRQKSKSLFAEMSEVDIISILIKQPEFSKLLLEAKNAEDDDD